MDLDRLMLYCRLSRRYTGYLELQECLKIALEDEERLLYVTGIYREVGEKFYGSAGRIERNIRTLLNYSWKNGGKEPLEKIFGRKLDSKPRVGEVIEGFVCYLKGYQGEDITF